MVDPFTTSNQSPSDTGPVSSEAGRGTPFVLQNNEQNITFAPRYFPETFRRVKERDLNRKDQFCEGENVTDQGGKNWNIHVVGRVLTQELSVYDRVAEEGKELLLTSLSWSGEVLVDTCELEGPVAWDPQQNQYQWRYTADLVSTGRDELGSNFENGIISDGDTTSGGGGSTEPFSP